MKKLILLFLLLPVLTFAQTTVGGMAADTLNKDGYKVVNFPGKWKAPVTLYYQITTDTVSGFVKWMSYLEHSPDQGRTWYTMKLDSLVTDRDTNLYYQEDEWYSSQYRLRILAIDSTQTFQYRIEYDINKKE